MECNVTCLTRLALTNMKLGLFTILRTQALLYNKHANMATFIKGESFKVLSHLVVAQRHHHQHHKLIYLV
jgi:hypothetical protein